MQISPDNESWRRTLSCIVLYLQLSWFWELINATECLTDSIRVALEHRPCPLLSKATSSQVPPTQTQSAGWLLATPLLLGHSVLASLSDALCFPPLLFCLALAFWVWHTVLAVEKSPVILEHVNILQTWRTCCLKTMLRNYIGPGTFLFTLTCSLW